MVVQLIQNLVWIHLKWWINRPSKTIWMNLNGSTACYQHCSNGITMCVQNQWAFFKVEILNGFKWSISRRVKENNKCIIRLFRVYSLKSNSTNGQIKTHTHTHTKSSFFNFPSTSSGLQTANDRRPTRELQRHVKPWYKGLFLYFCSVLVHILAIIRLPR